MIFPIATFWKKYPAFFFGLILFLGTAMALQFHPLLPVVALLLIVSAASKRLSIAGLFCFIAAIFLTNYRCPKIVMPQQQISGTGLFHIEQIKPTSSPFQRYILYQGRFKTFQSENNFFENIPCILCQPLKTPKLLESSDYEMQGTLIQKNERSLLFKPKQKKPLPSRFNLAKMRYQWKQNIASYLKKEISNPHAGSLLLSLATGEIDERILAMEFGKLGLQHLLAISGFHFALAALFLKALLRLFLPPTLSLICVLIGLSLYALFLGNTPSIQRAYITICFITISSLWSLKASPINSAGACMIIELLFQPLSAMSMSFQLTFLCTLAILLFYPLMDQWIAFVLPKRSYKKATTLSMLDKHGYLFATFLRKILALNLAVHLVSLPVLLFLFHKFPCLSFAYNLFFPLLISLSMLLLFLGCISSLFFPFFSHSVHSLNNGWTSIILEWTSNPPAFLDFYVRTKQISLSMLICFLGAILFLGIQFQEKVLKKNVQI